MDTQSEFITVSSDEDIETENETYGPPPAKLFKTHRTTNVNEYRRNSAHFDSDNTNSPLSVATETYSYDEDVHLFDEDTMPTDSLTSSNASAQNAINGTSNADQNVTDQITGDYSSNTSSLNGNGHDLPGTSNFISLHNSPQNASHQSSSRGKTEKHKRGSAPLEKVNSSNIVQYDISQNNSFSIMTEVMQRISDSLTQNKPIQICIKTIVDNESKQKSISSINTSKTSKNPPQKRARSYGQVKHENYIKLTKMLEKRCEKFESLINSVRINRHFRNLLSPEENQVLSDFITLPKLHKYFVFQLFIGKNVWYNRNNFAVSELQLTDDKQVQDIVKKLTAKQFLETDYTNSEEPKDLLYAIDFESIREIMKKLGMSEIVNMKRKTISAKQEIIRIACDNFQKMLDKSLFMKEIYRNLGKAIRLTSVVKTALHYTYFLATFTNSDFLDIQQYFTSVVDQGCEFPETQIEFCIVFETRQSFQSYFVAVQTKETLKQQPMFDIVSIGEKLYNRLKSDNDQMANQSWYRDTPHFKKFTATYMNHIILSQCCQLVFHDDKAASLSEKLTKWLEKLIEKYPNSPDLGEWYYMLIHSFKKNRNTHKKAARLLIEAFTVHGNSLNELNKFKLKLLSKDLVHNKTYGIDRIDCDKILELIPASIDLSTVPRSQVSKTEKYKRNQSYLADVSRHYKQSGYLEIIETNYVKSLFLLFFWDIIYNPVSSVVGTFIHNLQTAPLDFDTPYFYEKRKDAIDIRLNQIKAKWTVEDLIEFGTAQYKNNSHRVGPYGQIMGPKDSNKIEPILTTIGRDILSNIFKRLIENPSDNVNGLPEILIWKDHKKEDNDYKFVYFEKSKEKIEITKQIWIKYLLEVGAAVEICVIT